MCAVDEIVETKMVSCVCLNFLESSTAQCAQIFLVFFLLGATVFPMGAHAETLPRSVGAWPDVEVPSKGGERKVMPGNGFVAHAADKVPVTAYGFAADDSSHEVGLSSNAGLKAFAKSDAPIALTFDGAVDVLRNSDPEFSLDHERSSSFASEDRTGQSILELYACGVNSKNFGYYANTRYCIRYIF